MDMAKREIIDINLGKLEMGPMVYDIFYNPETYKDPKSTDPAGKIEAFLTVRKLI